jgi:hypothetical protein
MPMNILIKSIVTLGLVFLILSFQYGIILLFFLLIEQIAHPRKSLMIRLSNYIETLILKQ